MQIAYARLALDGNYHLDNIPCPYLPNAYTNTAHGTHGLSAAPVCTAAIAADTLSLPQPSSQRLRAALHPNRTVIRAIVRQQPSFRCNTQAVWKQYGEYPIRTISRLVTIPFYSTTAV